MVEKKLRPYIGMKTNFFHVIYIEGIFFQDFLLYTIKNKWSFYVR